MTVQEIGTLVGALGFPIVLVGAGLWFATARFWPWWMVRQAALDTAKAKREDSYVSEIVQTRQVYERVIAALDRLLVKLDVQHAEVMHELRASRRHIEVPAETAHG